MYIIEGCVSDVMGYPFKDFVDEFYEKRRAIKR
jgi:hypothetical protein